MGSYSNSNNKIALLQIIIITINQIIINNSNYMMKIMMKSLSKFGKLTKIKGKISELKSEKNIIKIYSIKNVSNYSFKWKIIKICLINTRITRLVK